MALPKDISPNPLLISAVEIRFSSKISSEDILSTIYPIISKNFPKVKDAAKIPEITGQPGAIRFSSGYIFANDKYSLTVSPTSVAFENIGGYHKWPNYFPVIKENIGLLSKTMAWDKLQRIGLRYANFFENQTSIIEALNLSSTADFAGLKQDVQILRTIYTKDDINLHLQVAKNASIKKSGKDTYGLYVDIDASVEGDFKKSDEEIFALIDKLHTELKELLFNNVMRKDFLKALKATY